MIKMKRDVPPCMVSDLASFSPFPYPYCAKNDRTQTSTLGQVSRDGMWAWIARDSIIEVFSTHTGERCSAWCFGAVLKNTSLTVTAVTEFCSSYLSYPCLLIALESENAGALLCMFDIKTSKVIKVIELPYKVTSLEVISREGGACMETHPLSSELRCMFGIAAVGTENGHILLVDLCLDEENYSTELTPNKATFVTKQTSNIAAKREIALAHSQHLCLSINEDSFHYDMFEYKTQSKISPVSFSADDVTVSTMKYVRNLASLVVGFSFGGIQLWNLQDLFLQYTIPLHASQQSIVQFAFQEPENDPRNFCYLWAIRGYYQGEHNSPDSVSVATLYSLSYTRKDWLNNYGFLYQEFQGCSKRFEYALSTDPYCSGNHNVSHCSRLITCHVVPQNDILNKLDHEDPLQSEEWNSSEDLSVCVLAWETWPTMGNVPSSCFLILFDINQWYQAQMPSVVRCSQGELCSYLGVFSLQEITKITNQTNPESLLDIYVIPHSLTKFKCLTVAEEFFYPSSLSFRIWCISEGGILQASYLGAQRQLLSEMTLNGPSCIVDPKELYSLCLISGLMSHIHESAPGKHVTTSWQREALLTLALENSMSHFLTSCVQQWSSSEFSHAGCSLKSLLDWGWKRVTQIKSSIDKICLPLFNCSGQGLDKNTLQILHSYESQLKHLINIVALLQNLPGPTTEQGQRELQLRKEVVQSIGIYLQVLLWLYDCHLLPEHLEGDEYGEDEVSYPISRLSRTYSCKRLELQKLHSSVGQTDVLLVDGMVSEMGTSVAAVWEKLGGNGIYPPPSFYASLSTYLVDGVPVMHKHLLMFYLLLDISAFLSDRQSHLIEKLMRFPSICNISSSIIKLTHAFWLLDHQDFEEAISLFLDPVILSINIEPWHHTRILKSFLYQGQEQKALKYMNVRKPPQHTAEEVKLHLSVLLANGLTAEAFNYQRQHRDNNNVEDLLTHFFIGCQQTHALDALLQLPLNSAENAALARFLHSSSEPQAQELLVIFYLLRCRPLEAANLNDKLVSQIMERSVKSRERATSRNALVTGFLHTLPEEQKIFAQELSQIDNPPYIFNREERPRPLSTSVTCGSLAFLSYSDVLNAVMSKVTDTCQEMSVVQQSPLKTHLKPSVESTPFIGTSVTPHIRSERRDSDVIFATPVSKRSILHTADHHEFVSPTKKSRFMDTVSFKGLDSDRRRNQKHLTGEVLSLLQTPPVCRKSLGPRPIELLENTSGITPQSILKVRNLLQRSLSPQDEELSPVKPIPMNLKVDTMEQDDEKNEEELEVESFKSNERPSMLNAAASKSERSDVIEAEVAEIVFNKQLNKNISIDDKVQFHNDDINSKQLRFQVPTEMNTSSLLKWVSSRSEMSSEQKMKRNLTVKEIFTSSERLLHKAEIQKATDRCTSPCCSDFSSTSERSLRASPRRPLRDVQHNNSSDKILPSVLDVQASAEPEQAMQVEELDENSSDISFEGNRSLTEERESPLKFIEKTEILDEKNNTSLGNENEMHFLHLSESESESENENLDKFKTLETHVISDGNISHEREVIENISNTQDYIKHGSGVDKEQIKEAEETNISLLTSTQIVSPNVFTAMTPPSSTPVTPQKESSPSSNQDLLGSPFQSTRSRTQFQSDSSTNTSLSLSTDKKKIPDKSYSTSPKANKSQEKSKGDKQNVDVRERGQPIKDSEHRIQTLLPSLEVHQEEVGHHVEHMERSPKLTSRSNKQEETSVNECKAGPDLQFTFSQPHISDDPGTLAALDSFQTPVPQFVFSPPVTRARSRQKKLDETLSSSIMSTTADTSFSNAKKSPDHTLALDTSIVQTVEVSTPTEETSSINALRKKSGAKTKKYQKPSQLPVSQSVINLVSPLDHEDSSSVNFQQLSTSSRHSMILRKSRIKKKSVKLW